MIENGVGVELGSGNDKGMLRRFFIVGILLLVTAAIVVVWSIFALAPLCSSEVLQEAVSPDRRFRASISEGSCGATTDVTTYITLVRNFDTPLAAEANVLVADGGRARLGSSIRWTGPRKLVVFWRGAEQIFLAEAEVLGVSVEYEKP